MRGKYKLLARLMDPEEYEKFIGSIKKEKQLRQRIKDLSKYRKNGITKLEGNTNTNQTSCYQFFFCASECSEFDTLRPDKGKKQDSENMEDNAQDGKFITVAYTVMFMLKNLNITFYFCPSHFFQTWTKSC